MAGPKPQKAVAAAEKLQHICERGKQLHRLQEVREQQRVTINTVCSHLKMTPEQARKAEQPNRDILLSDLYRWQVILGVPMSELLLDEGTAVLIKHRSRLVRLMKTVRLLQDQAPTTGIRALADNLESQLLEMMPELKAVEGWPGGQRRTLAEVGRIAEVRTELPDEYDFDTPDMGIKDTCVNDEP